MTAPAALAGLRTLIGGLDSVGLVLPVEVGTYDVDKVTAVVGFGSPPADYDIEEPNAYAVNFDVFIVCPGETLITAQERVARVLHDLGVLWWTEAATTLGGAAERAEWRQSFDFEIESKAQGKAALSVTLEVMAIVSTQSRGAADG